MIAAISLGLIHFKTCSVDNLRLALRSVASQDLSRVAHLMVYNNDSGISLESIAILLDEEFNHRRFVAIAHDTHGDPTKTHPYSVNRAFATLPGPGIFITRSDYILSPDAIPMAIEEAERMQAEGLKPFVTGLCYQSAYDRDERAYPDYGDISGKSFEELLALPGHTFGETDQDAGVFLTLKEYWRLCPLNEKLSAWGYAQSTWQRQLVNEVGVSMRALQRVLFFHQQHGEWDRDHGLARAQYNQFGEGK